MSDAELLRGVRQGAEGAFERLYRRHKDAVFRYACALSGSVADGEDLLQEAFLGLLRNVDSFDTTRPLLPYLLQSVRHRHLDRLRSFARRGRPLPDDDVASPAAGSGADGVLLDRERTALVAEALAGLPDAQQEVVRLHVFAGMSYRDIAEARQTPVATVRTRYRAALERLRRLLGRRVGHEGP